MTNYTVRSYIFVKSLSAVNFKFKLILPFDYRLTDSVFPKYIFVQLKMLYNIKSENFKAEKFHFQAEK